MRDFLWFPQLDLYDTVRRQLLVVVASSSDRTLSREQLFIVDFFLANPTLLHRTKMTLAGREAFRALELPRESFLQLPPTPILFERMSGIQGLAFHNLVGRGALDLEAVKADQVKLFDLGRALAEVAIFSDDMESRLLNFLTGPFVMSGDPAALRSATGLRRVLI